GTHRVHPAPLPRIATAAPETFRRLLLPSGRPHGLGHSLKPPWTAVRIASPTQCWVSQRGRCHEDPAVEHRCLAAIQSRIREFLRLLLPAPCPGFLFSETLPARPTDGVTMCQYHDESLALF